jgi:hypothetical protein
MPQVKLSWFRRHPGQKAGVAAIFAKRAGAFHAVHFARCGRGQEWSRRRTVSLVFACMSWVDAHVVAAAGLPAAANPQAHEDGTEIRIWT